MKCICFLSSKMLVLAAFDKDLSFMQVSPVRDE